MELGTFENAIGSDLQIQWNLVAAWKGGRRSIEVIDAGKRGLWVVTRLDTGDEVRPTTATEIWRQLVTLLPTDEEFDSPTGVSGENEASLQSPS